MTLGAVVCEGWSCREEVIDDRTESLMAVCEKDMGYGKGVVSNTAAIDSSSTRES